MNSSQIISLVILLFVCTVQPMIAQGNGPRAGDSIRISIGCIHEGENLMLCAKAVSPAETDTLRYKLLVSRKGQHGLSSSSQIGNFTLREDLESTLATTSVNLEEGEECHAELIVYWGALRIAKVDQTFKPEH